MSPRLIHFKSVADARGNLIAVEAERSIPFPIRRVYYIFGTKPGIERGFHAHKALQQVAVAVSGSCEITLDDGASTACISLDSPAKGVFIGPGLWRAIRRFTPDCVLVVFADQYYEEADYIRNYDDFIRWTKKND